MTLERQVTFWIAAFVVLVALLWLLSDVLLPFVAGMALAYLLDPLATRLERLGLNRAMATLLIVVLVLVALTLLIILLAPILGSQLAALIARLPATIARLQALLADPSSTWLGRLIGDYDVSKWTGDLLSKATGWLAAFLGSLWSGGKALLSVFSLLVITPVVAFYLLYDWDRMITRDRKSVV